MGLLFISRHQGHIIPWQHRREKRPQAVIIRPQDRIKLVIVAAGAPHAQPKKRIGCHVRHVDQHLVPLLFDIALVVFVKPRSQITRGHDHIRIVRSQLIAGQLLDDKPIIGLIAVKRPDHIIAIGPGVGPIGILLEPIRLGIPNQIKPMPAPSFAIVRAGQQPVDQSLIGVGPRILDERPNLARRRGKPDQIKCRPANERHPIRRRRRFQPFGIQLRKNKPIHVIAAPFAAGGWDGLLFHGNKGPIRTIGWRDDAMPAKGETLRGDKDRQQSQQGKVEGPKAMWHHGIPVELGRAHP